MCDSNHDAVMTQIVNRDRQRSTNGAQADTIQTIHLEAKYMESYTIREATPDDSAAVIIHNDLIANEPHNGIIRGPGESMTLEEEQIYLKNSLASDNSILLIAITP